jgi:serine protease AprX
MQQMPRLGRGNSPVTVPRSPTRRRRSLAVTLSVVALAAVGLGAPSAAATGGTSVRVVVTGPDAASTARAVIAAGGTVTATLPLIGGAEATLPSGAVLPAGFMVTPNRGISFAGTETSPGAITSTVRSTLGLAPDGDEGRGVTVAIVDTGVADVADLRGRVVGHLDITGSGAGDGYGHGTFLAGLIAGDGTASGGAYVGVAPAAKILDVKVARQDGSTDLGAVLSGLQAVADQGKRYGVDVINLSLASGSPVPYQVDPLDQALRALWQQGYTVVVAAGNDGPGAATIAAPGNDPTLISVGGIDEHGTSAREDDTVADWSARGPTSQGVAKPDVVAPGTSLVGLRSAGSVADVEHPQARIGSDYFRGSGTSMSAAVVSGAVAALIDRQPGLQPDGVKSLLVATAYRSGGLMEATAAGAGGIDLAAALSQARRYTGGGPHRDQVAPGSPDSWNRLASALDAGNLDQAQRAWDALSPEARSWAARSWASLDPDTQAWVARSWAARSWAGTGADSADWAARSWAARSWAGDDWAARSWAARSWAGDDWAARSWAARSWAAQSWAAQW